MTVTHTPIEGLLEVKLDVKRDERGSFREVFQAEKLRSQGMPDFTVVQQNVSYNNKRGVTRGIHAEPWEKFVTVGYGEVFVAVADLRPGENFGKLHTLTLDENKALFIPRGCGNSYQTLTDEVVYSYLVSDYWRPDIKYVLVNVADDTLNIDWPIPLSQAIVSDKDKEHPTIKELQARGGLT